MPEAVPLDRYLRLRNVMLLLLILPRSEESLSEGNLAMAQSSCLISFTSQATRFHPLEHQEVPVVQGSAYVA